MKKISVLLIAVFILNIFLVGSVFAANVCKISASFDRNSQYQGKEVTIKISASEITEEIAAVGFTLNYDSNIFEYSGIEKAEGWSIVPIEGIQFSIHTDSYEGTKTAGIIGTIKLKVKDNANLGNTLIKISNIEVAKDDTSIIKIGDLEQNILIQKEEIKQNEDSNITNTNTSTNTDTNTIADTNTSINTNTNANKSGSTKENASISNEKNNVTNINTNYEKANAKEEKKKSVLPYTGKTPMFIGSILIVVSIFVIISYKKYLKYKNI